VVSDAWDSVSERWPSLVGGCRPIELTMLLEPSARQIEHQEVLTRWAFRHNSSWRRRRGMSGVPVTGTTNARATMQIETQSREGSDEREPPDKE
jgi:hypothetical protein